MYFMEYSEKHREIYKSFDRTVKSWVKRKISNSSEKIICPRTIQRYLNNPDEMPVNLTPSALFIIMQGIREQIHANQIKIKKMNDKSFNLIKSNIQLRVKLNSYEDND